MACILVIYEDTRCGSPALDAEAVAHGASTVKGANVLLRSLDQASAADLRWCDALAIEAADRRDGVSSRMKQWWDHLGFHAWGDALVGKYGCSFSGAGPHREAPHDITATLTALLQRRGITVIGNEQDATSASPSEAARQAGQDGDPGARLHDLGRTLAERAGRHPDAHFKRRFAASGWRRNACADRAARPSVTISE